MTREIQVEEFHKLFYQEYRNFLCRNTFWNGVPCVKNPLDLWIYQEIIHEIKPDLIIETGTACGGSAAFMADVMDGTGTVCTIDPDDTFDYRPKHLDIHYYKYSSLDPQVIEAIHDDFVLDPDQRKIMVVLDSLHEKDHVLRELEIYSRFVSLGSYLIVEDTNIFGHPVNLEHGPGPHEAVEEFLKSDPGKHFMIDKSREKYLLSFNPDGYLKRIS